MEAASVFKDDKAKLRVLELYEGVIARWPLPCERLRVATGAGETAVLAFGKEGSVRRPLVLLHGTGSNSSIWLGEAVTLGRDRRVFALDIPGEPGMSAEARMDWQGTGSAAWFGEAIAALGFRGGSGPGAGEHDVLGLSIGGWIGLSYAIGRPAGLHALALLCPSGLGRTRPSFTWKAILASMRGREGVEAISRLLYGDEEPNPEALRIGTLMAEATRPRFETPRIFSDEEIAGIAARVFLAAGSKDALLRSKESIRRLSKLKPEAEELFLEGRGHVLTGLGPPILEFLDR